MVPFRFGIMGAGLIARKFCEAVALLPDVVVAGVASKSLERAEAFARSHGIPFACDSYEALLTEQRPDAVYIATTTNAHLELTLLCLRHGVPVLCEKAMFMSEADARLAMDEAQKSHTFMMEALWSRFLPANLRARQWVQEGRIGAPVVGEFSIGFVAPPDAANRYYSPALGGGAAYDLSVYGYALLPWLMNRQILAQQSSVTAAATGVDASETILLSLDGQAQGVIQSSIAASLDNRAVLCGDRGRIVVPCAHFAGEAMLYDAAGRLVEHYVDTETKNGFTYEIQEVVRCVRAGCTESPAMPFKDTLACAKGFDLLLAPIR